jgi:dTDP-4-dehydrorhamnose reductase
MIEQEHVLITGCGGMLGKAMYAKTVEKYGESFVRATDIDLNEPWLSKLDVRDIREYEEAVREWKPSIIIHLAALTDLEYCEKNSNDAWATNALGAENAAILAHKYNVLLVYISTAGIFDGGKDEYTDFDTPNPLGYYAKSKCHGEKFVEQHLSKYYIFRAGWMMGGGLKKDKKFINKIYKQIKSGSKELFVVDDKLGTPTYTVDFASAIMKVIDSDYYGLYNQVCEGSCSRFDVAEEFIKQLELTDKIKVTKVSSDYWKEEYFAPRPASEKLINVKLTMRGINYMRDWRVCLAEYAQEFKKDFYGTL